MLVCATRHDPTPVELSHPRSLSVPAISKQLARLLIHFVSRGQKDASNTNSSLSFTVVVRTLFIGRSPAFPSAASPSNNRTHPDLWHLRHPFYLSPCQPRNANFLRTFYRELVTFAFLPPRMKANRRWSLPRFACLSTASLRVTGNL